MHQIIRCSFVLCKYPPTSFHYQTCMFARPKERLHCLLSMQLCKFNCYAMFVMNENCRCSQLGFLPVRANMSEKNGYLSLLSLATIFFCQCDINLLLINWSISMPTTSTVPPLYVTVQIQNKHKLPNRGLKETIRAKVLNAETSCAVTHTQSGTVEKTLRELIYLKLTESQHCGVHCSLHAVYA